MSDYNEFICPITLEPIENISYTIFNNYYETSEITKWLDRSGIDPSSGFSLPTNELFKTKHDHSLRTIWKSRLDYRNIEMRHLALLQIKKSNRTKKEEFLTYSKLAIEKLFSNDVLYDDHLMINDEILKRPPKTGMSYQFMNMSEYIFISLHFDSIMFDFEDMTKCEFTDCVFDKCTFTGTNLNNTCFTNCGFSEDETVFFESSSKCIILTDCYIFNDNHKYYNDEFFEKIKDKYLDL
jgi:hypothetical protein